LFICLLSSHQTILLFLCCTAAALMSCTFIYISHIRVILCQITKIQKECLQLMSRLKQCVYIKRNIYRKQNIHITDIYLFFRSAPCIVVPGVMAFKSWKLYFWN
jgi:hypothetical protein